MAFAEVCTTLPSYAKAESHYIWVGRAYLASPSLNYVTAGISINGFMMLLRCLVSTIWWSHTGCQMRVFSGHKCISILAVKWILTHTIYGTCLSVSFKYRSSQLFGNLKLLCKVFGGRNMWKLAVKISQNGFSFKGFVFFSLLNYLRVWVAIKFLLYLNFSEFLWTYTLVQWLQ